MVIGKWFYEKTTSPFVTLVVLTDSIRTASLEEHENL